jgi:ribosomal protein S18 acetylase RimI-like enzyme
VDASLREFRRTDAEALLALSRRALAREEEQVGAPLWATRDELEAELAGLDRAPEETLRVIEDEGVAAAFGGVELEDEATLFGPLVAPAFRGRKFGRLLLDASIALAREKRVELLFAAVGAHNLGGRMLLEHAGFEPGEGLHAVYRLLPDAHLAIEPPREGVPSGDSHVTVTLKTTRRAGSGDLERVLDLCHECFVRSRLSDEAWRRGLERGEVRLAEEDGVPVAIVRINRSRRRVFHGVTASARARGVGGFVLSEALEDYWREHPGEALRLAAPVENVAASRLYRRQGFVPWLVLQRFELALWGGPAGQPGQGI